MINRMIKFFDKEINAVRYGMDSFRKKYRQESDTLNINEGYEQDPNVSRIIDSFSWLTAQNNIEIEKLKNQHIDSLINSVSPNLFKAIPDVINYSLNLDADVNKVICLSNDNVLEVEIKEEKFKLTPAYPTNILPCKVIDTQHLSAPFNHVTPKGLTTETCIRIVIGKIEDEIDLKQCLANDFVLHVSSNDTTERALSDILQQAIAKMTLSSDQFEQPIVLNDDVFHPVVLNEKYLATPVKPNEIKTLFQFKEFFGCREKLNFFAVEHLPVDEITVAEEVYLDLYVNINSEHVELISQLSFSLNKGLLRNLFKKQSEPITVNNNELSYPIFSDSNDQSNIKICSLDAIYHIEGERIKKVKHVLGSELIDFKKELYWDQDVQLNHAGLEEYHLILPILSSLIHATFYADITCSSTMIKNNIFTGDVIEETSSSFLPGEISIDGYSFQGNTSRVSNDNYWQFLKLLSFNTSNLLNNASAKSELVFYLGLLNDISSVCEEIQAIKSVQVKASSHRFVIDGSVMFVAGNDITITLDNEQKKANYYLFAALLNDFYHALTSYDRYTSLTVEFTNFNWQSIEFSPKLGDRSTF